MPVLWQLADPSRFDLFGAGLKGYQAGNQFRSEREKRAVLSELANLPPDADLGPLAMRIMSVDPQAGATLANLGLAREDRTIRRENRQEDITFRREEAQRAQRNADRSYGLQAQQLNRPDIQMAEDEFGRKRPVLIDRRTGEMRPAGMTPGSAMPPPAAPRNPYAMPGKPTEGQANAALYANRMANSHKILGELEGINADLAGGAAGVLESLTPAPIFNLGATKQRQQFMQAKRDFINAALRRESGAAISPSEFASADQQYFPQPGDSKEVIAQKRANREQAIQGIMGAAGPGYTPPATFRPGQGGQTPAANSPSGNARVSSGGSTGAPMYREGDTATNPRTGQKLEFRNGQWNPVR